MTTRDDLARRIAELSEEWEEQNRALYWILRDLGGDPARLLGESPFRAAPVSRTSLSSLASSSVHATTSAHAVIISAGIPGR